MWLENGGSLVTRPLTMGCLPLFALTHRYLLYLDTWYALGTYLR